MTAVMTFENVRFCYGAVCAIGGVNFALEPNALTALVGPNGGGKTTLIKLMAGLLKPEDGRIVRARGSAVGYVPQAAVFDTSFPVTVGDMVLMGTLGSGAALHRYTRTDRQAAAEAIARVGLAGFERRGIDQLSGGQLRRALIARALASSAGIIALDEPDASLDTDAAGALYDVLSELKTDRTVVVASHNINAILGIADRAVYVNREAEVYGDPMQLKDKLKGGMLL